jgi:O-antigen/teichoic acid export membrane protein
MKNKFRSKIKSYSNNKHFLSLSGNLAIQVVNTIYFALLFRYMKVEELGSYVFFNSILGLLDALRSGFINTAFIRAYSGATSNRAAEVMGSTWMNSLLLTLSIVALNLIALLIIGPLENEGINLFFRWAGLTLLLMLPSFVAMCVLQAEQRFDKLLYVRALQLGLSVLGLLGLMVFHKVELNYVIYVNLIAAAITSVLTLITGWTKLKYIKFQTKTCIKELAHFGKYSVGSQIGSTLLRNSDTFIINFMLGAASLAVYNLAQRFMIIVELLVGSSLATAVPALASAYNRDNTEELTIILTKYVGLLTWMLVPIIVGTILLADIPVHLLGGSQYVGTQAANLLRIFMATAILFPVDRFTGITLDVINKPNLNLIKVFIMLSVNVVGDFIGIELFDSIYGVAIASIPTVIAGFVFGYLHLKKKLLLSIADIIFIGFAELRDMLKNVLGFAKNIRRVDS